MIETRTVTAFLTEDDLTWLGTGAFQFATPINDRAILAIDTDIATPGGGYESRTFSSEVGLADWINAGGSFIGAWPVNGRMLALKFLFVPGEGPGEGEVPGAGEDPGAGE